MSLFMSFYVIYECQVRLSKKSSDMLTSRSTATMCSFLSLSITELSSITVETKVKGVSSTKRGFCKKGKKSYCHRTKFLKK